MNNKNNSGDYIQNQFWYRQKVLERIWELKRKLKLHPSEFLKKSEYDFNDFELIFAVHRLFGNWENALIAAGIPISPNGKKQHWQEKENQKNEKRFTPSKKRVLEIIAGLAEAGEDISPENIIVMYNDLWHYTCGKAGYFSNWQTMLRSAGVNLKNLPEIPYWSPDRLANTINDLYESQLLLSPQFIKENYWYLYRYSLKYFGSWYSALDASSLRYDSVTEEIRTVTLRQQQMQQNLPALLNHLGKQVHILNENEMNYLQNMHLLGLFCEEETGGTIIGTLPRSWYPGIEKQLLKLLRTHPGLKIELFYQKGEPRQWNSNRVIFTDICDLVPSALEAGADEALKRILQVQYNDII